MSSFGIEWQYVVKLPFQDKLHDAIHAFLRTSDHGEWTADDKEPSDGFFLHYRRGNWRRSLLGFGTALVPACTSFPESKKTKTIPMQLQLKVRPGPETIITARYRAFFSYDAKWSWPKELKVAEQRVADVVRAEIDALLRYLTEVYGTSPELTTC